MLIIISAWEEKLHSVTSQPKGGCKHCRDEKDDDEGSGDGEGSDDDDKGHGSERGVGSSKGKFAWRHSGMTMTKKMETHAAVKGKGKAWERKASTAPKDKGRQSNGTNIEKMSHIALKSYPTPPPLQTSSIYLQWQWRRVLLW
jgi:hypothetical protein